MHGCNTVEADLLSQVYLDGNVATITSAKFCPGYIFMVEHS